MQNNVTDLLQKLQRSLDNNYNVIDMPAVVEIISTLEKTTVTKELLETTRLGKYINELRRRTTNETLAKRAKELVKKWRVFILPSEANGQIKSSAINSERSDSPDLKQLKNRKRPVKEMGITETNINKRSILNGQNREFDFSDNSNCSIKDVKKTDVIFINSDSNSSIPEQSTDSFSRSQSNDAFDLQLQKPTQPQIQPEQEPPQPKKRGRKKGSKNHKNLIVAAEESFTNKMSAISRNSKVKTTQELLADIQNRKPDIELRAAQLTESLSRIDQKLNPQKKINQNVTPIIKNDKKPEKINNVEESLDSKFNRLKQESEGGSSRVSTPEVVVVPSDDELVDVVGTDPAPPPPPDPQTQPLTIENILNQLPPVDYSDVKEDIPLCTCPVPVSKEIDKITVQIVDDKKEPYTSIFCTSPMNSPKNDDNDNKNSDTCEEDDELITSCPTRLYLQDKYKLNCVSDESVENLKVNCLENINGNYGFEVSKRESDLQDNGLYINIVPKIESLRKDLSGCSYLNPCENYNKYSISITNTNNTISNCYNNNNSTDVTVRNCDNVMDNSCVITKDTSDSNNSERPVNRNLQFLEWHESLDIESYNGETLRILPYVIID